MAQWEENKHPRDDDGKFTSGGGTPAENKKLEEMGISSKGDTKSSLSAEEQRLKEMGIDTNELETQVDKVLNGTYKDSHITLCENTPKILQDIGVPNKPLLMTAKHVYLAINKEGKYNAEKDHYHDLGKETFQMIPKLLQSPEMVLQSNKNKDDIVVVLNWYDKDKNILICPIRVGGTGRYNEVTIEGNIVKSVYGKQNFDNYINKNFSQKDILYAGNKKIRGLH